MKASDAKRAAILVEAHKRIARVTADMERKPSKGYEIRALELMAVSFNDREDIDCDADLYVDATIGLALLPLLKGLIEQELRAMGVELED
jgi:hypothetical protein